MAVDWGDYDHSNGRAPRQCPAPCDACETFPRVSYVTGAQAVAGASRKFARAAALRLVVCVSVSCGLAALVPRRSCSASLRVGPQGVWKYRVLFRVPPIRFRLQGRDTHHVGHGSGELDAREGAASRRSRRGRLFELVRTHGARWQRRGDGQTVGADALSQELDSIPLCRAGAGLLAMPSSRDFSRIELTVRSRRYPDLAAQDQAGRVGHRNARDP